MVFQEGAVRLLSVRDNVAYQLIQELVPDDEIDRASTKPDLCRARQHICLLSRQPLRRMRRRVAIARASFTSPNCCSTTRPPAASTPLPQPPSSSSSSRSATSSAPPPSCYAPPARRLHPLHPPLRPELGRMVPSPTARPTQHHFPHARRSRLIFNGSLHELLQPTTSSSASSWSRTYASKQR